MIQFSSLRSVFVATMAMVGGLFVLSPSVSSQALPAVRAGTVRAASCADDCNHKASDCLDGCEEKFKDDDKARVTCKFACATTRQQCEKDCS